jgi:hypothetical protein
MGLRDGLLPYELPAIAVSCGLILAFPFVAVPTGLAAIAIVVSLIARRAFKEFRGASRAAVRKTAPA